MARSNQSIEYFYTLIDQNPRLLPREKQILWYRLNGCTLDEIAKTTPAVRERYNSAYKQDGVIERERVRQLEARALRKMRQFLNITCKIMKGENKNGSA